MNVVPFPSFATSAISVFCQKVAFRILPLEFGHLPVSIFLIFALTGAQYNSPWQRPGSTNLS
jgi:hypothetical protein